MAVIFNYSGLQLCPLPLYLASSGGDDHALMTCSDEKNEHASSPPLEGNRGKKEKHKKLLPYPVLQRDFQGDRLTAERDFQGDRLTAGGHFACLEKSLFQEKAPSKISLSYQPRSSILCLIRIKNMVTVQAQVIPSD
jgi:hypothetical protein